MFYPLYAAPLSLYSGKAPDYLRWKNVAFKEALTTRVVYKSEILPRIGWPVMPVLITPKDTMVHPRLAHKNFKLHPSTHKAA